MLRANSHYFYIALLPDFGTRIFQRKGAKALRFLCYVAISTISISCSAGREMDFAATLWFVS